MAEFQKVRFSTGKEKTISSTIAFDPHTQKALGFMPINDEGNVIEPENAPVIEKKSDPVAEVNPVTEDTPMEFINVAEELAEPGVEAPRPKGRPKKATK